MENLSEKILEEIKEKKITPKPRWGFLLKNYLIWISGIFSLIIGSLSFAVAIFAIRHNDWDMSRRMVGSVWKFALLTLPYLWIICLGIFAFLIYYNFKHTKSGYKYPFYIVVFGVVFLSIIFGVLFYGIGLGQAVENAFLRKMPFFREHLDPRFRIWNQPERGFLMGEVEAPKEGKGFRIRDFRNKEWFIKSMPKNLKKGEIFKIIGKKIDDENFEASEIRPFNQRARGLFYNLK